MSGASIEGPGEFDSLSILTSFCYSFILIGADLLSKYLEIFYKWER